MILETKNKTIKLVLKTRKIVDISNVLKSKNFEEVFTKAYAICDLDALTKILYRRWEWKKCIYKFRRSLWLFGWLQKRK